jgi:hypothetical protein
VLVALQVSLKHRGFNQMVKGQQIIEFANGDVLEFLQMPCFLTKGAAPAALHWPLCTTAQCVF